jgi:(E)-4-hydroxy-3-methylbut-2-enyl-diphosphate synthase
MSSYGDTPLGMVESALEFLRICEDENYHNIVLSMKSSNPQVMVQAYRLLIMKMAEQGMNYPLHLGVTEAGEGEDGRIKSSAGIGALLEDGIGDTIRVSLTEDPEFEIPVARALVARYNQREKLQQHIPEPEMIPYDPVTYSRRRTGSVYNIGGLKVPVVTGQVYDDITPGSLKSFGYRYVDSDDKWNISDQACDYLFIGNRALNFEIPGTLGIISGSEQNLKSVNVPVNFEVTDLNGILSGQLKLQPGTVLVIDTSNEHGMAEQRRIFIELMNKQVSVPVIIRRTYLSSNADEVALYAATDFGALLLDGFGDGIWIDAPDCDPKKINAIAFGILQAARTRISKTEYISCPSCGRTLFDLQETTAKIRARTSHLKGVKIGIMGCIVNGPGEMADADYGYVGTGPGKITLYKGKEVVSRNVDSAKAVDALIDLIKVNGDWIEPGLPN